MQKYIINLIVLCGVYNNYAMELSPRTIALKNFTDKARKHYSESATLEFLALGGGHLPHELIKNPCKDAFFAEIDKNPNVEFFITNGYFFTDPYCAKDFNKKSDEQMIESGYLYIPAKGGTHNISFNIPIKNLKQLVGFLSEHSKKIRVDTFETLLNEHSAKLTYSNIAKDQATLEELFKLIDELIRKEELTQIIFT